MDDIAQRESTGVDYYILLQQLILQIGESYSILSNVEERDGEIIRNLYQENFPNNQFSREMFLELISQEFKEISLQTKIFLFDENFQRDFIEPYIREKTQKQRKEIYKRTKQSNDIFKDIHMYDVIICPLILPKDIISFYIFLPKLNSGMSFFQNPKYPYPHFSFLNSLFSTYNVNIQYSNRIVISKPKERLKPCVKNIYSYCVLSEILNSEDFQKTIKGEPSLDWCIRKMDVSINMKLLGKFSIECFLKLLDPISAIFDFETLKFLEKHIDMKKYFAKSKTSISEPSSEATIMVNIENKENICHHTLYDTFSRTRSLERVLEICIQKSSRENCWHLLEENISLFPDLLMNWASLQDQFGGRFFRNRGNFRKFKKLMRRLHLSIPQCLFRQFPRRLPARKECKVCTRNINKALDQNILNFQNMNIVPPMQIISDFSAMNINQGRILTSTDYYPVNVPATFQQQYTPAFHGHRSDVSGQHNPAYHVLLHDPNNNAGYNNFYVFQHTNPNVAFPVPCQLAGTTCQPPTYIDK